jgi:hypothetical protein
LRRQKDEREERERGAQQTRKGKAKHTIVKDSIKPLRGTARGGTDVRTRALDQVEAKRPLQTRAETLRPPPRLADRAILPQAHRPPGPRDPQPSRTQANFHSQGRKTHNTQPQPSMPLAASSSASGSSISRSRGRRLGHQDAGTLVDPRTRVQAAQGQGSVGNRVQVPRAQTVASRTPVLVRSPHATPQPSRAVVGSVMSQTPAPRRPQPSQPPEGKLSPTDQQSSRSSHTRRQTAERPRNQYEPVPPVPPKDNPPVPPKDEWRQQQQHPNLVPTPLSARPRAAERAVRPSAPLGYKPDPMYATHQREPAEGSGAQRGYAQDRVGGRPSVPQPSTVSGYIPNPMFADRGGNESAESYRAAAAARRRAQSEQPPSGLRPRGYTAAAPPSRAREKRRVAKPSTPAPPPKKTGGGWLKRLLGANHGASTETLEWLCKDAAEIERGR